MGARRKGPGAFVTLFVAVEAGALGLVAVDPLTGLAVFVTVAMVVAVVSLVMAERSQGRYRASLAAKVATKPWSDADVLADEAALVEARRARLAVSVARTVREHYGPAAPAQRVVIDHHEPIREAS